MKKSLKWFVILVILGSLAGFVYQTDIQAVGEGLHQIGVHFVWIILVTFLAHLCGAISWSYALPGRYRLPFYQFFTIRFIGENIGLVNPANIVGGDSFKAYALERNGVPYRIGISSLVVSRIIMISVQVGLFVIAALIYLLITKDQTPLLFRVIYLSLLFLAVFCGFILAMNHLIKGNIFSRFAERESAKWIIERLSNLKSGMSEYYRSEPWRLFQSVLWSIINFLIGSLEIYIIFFLLGIEVTYLEALLIDQGILFLKSFGAFIPGQLGVEEYSNKLMLTIVGITSLNVWITVSVLRRARQLFWILISVLLYQWSIHRPKVNSVITNEKLSIKTNT